MGFELIQLSLLLGIVVIGFVLIGVYSISQNRNRTTASQPIKEQSTVIVPRLKKLSSSPQF